MQDPKQLQLFFKHAQKRTPRMVLSLDRWVDKVAVVTGTSFGIGAAIAEYLVEEGLIVAGIARRSHLVEEKAKNLSAKKGKLHAIKADLAKEEDILRAFKWIEKNLGHVHVLVNNAAIANETLLRNGDTAAWKQSVDVNLLGLCIATREAVKIMTENNIDGHIVHINSIMGHKVIPFPGINIYAATKFGVTAVAEVLRNELIEINSKIKVSSVSPGLVESEMTTLSTTITPERLQVMQSQPILKGEDVAEAVGYVLSTSGNVLIKELIITPVGERF